MTQPANRPAQPVEDEVVAAYAAGKPVEVIAAWYGIGVDEVRRIVSQQAYAADGIAPPVTPVAPARRRKWWPLAVGAAVAVLLVGGLIAAIAIDRQRAAEPEPAAQVSPFEQVQTRCDAGRAGTTVTDGGKTLLIDGSGEEDFGKLPASGLQCLLDALSTPAAVQSHMFGTRALDGRQEDSWPGYTASWSYHPDQGMDVIVRSAP